jgi:O-antigen biosynthesis protein
LPIRKMIRVSKRALKPVRDTAVAAGKKLSHVPGIGGVIKKGAPYILPLIGGPTGTAHARRLSRLITKRRARQYQQWFHNHWPNQTTLDGQRHDAQTFAYRPLISIIVPTYNTDSQYLQEAIKSVQEQTYDNWELCVADDASTDASVREIIEDYAQKDSRIKYIFREKNGHISQASNSALDLAGGEFVGLLDHDDVLWPNALYENVKRLNDNKKLDFLYSDEDKLSESGKRHEDPYFKPDWSPEQLRCHNYITHFAVIRRRLVQKVGGFRKGVEGAQDWDLFLRVTRETNNICHIPTILYSWRKAPTSTALRADAKDYAWKVQEKVLEDDLKARQEQGEVQTTAVLGLWNIAYQTKGTPLVSIIIPTKDQYKLIKQCLHSIFEKTLYKNFEVVIVDTGSSDQRVWQLYGEYADKNTRVVKWTKDFNFSAVCNLGAKHAKGDYFLFLNNDTEVISPNWIEGLLGYAHMDHVGAVGCKLLYPNLAIQHAGITLGMGGLPGVPAVAGHVFAGWHNEVQESMKVMLADVVRDSTAVTAACVMIARKKFEAVEGFDETYKIAFNDVDFCLKLRDKGYFNVYLGYVQLFHHESVSLGKHHERKRDTDLFKKEHVRIHKKWGSRIFAEDPFYNPNFSRKSGYAEINTKP